MSSTSTGNKNKNKNMPGLMDQYIQKDQATSFSSNKRQSSVLSPPDDEKLKAKKKFD